MAAATRSGFSIAMKWDAPSKTISRPCGTAPPRLVYDPVRVLVWHGFLLGGTGSNVYNARLCAALARQGHEISLLSQEPHAKSLEFIDAIGLSLTCDHQVIDGAPGARFLQVVKEKIENVESLCTISS